MALVEMSDLKGLSGKGGKRKDGKKPSVQAPPGVLDKVGKAFKWFLGIDKK